MKDYKYIKDLLERYYNARTSEAEEQQLKDFFLRKEVPVSLQQEKEMFLQLQKAKVPNGLEERLSQQIDYWETQEHRMHIVGSKKRRIRLEWIGSIAASLLLICGTSWYLSQPPTRQDTCATPEEAYAQAEKALTLFANAINKGMTHMESLQESTKKIDRNIQKQLVKLNTLEP